MQDRDDDDRPRQDRGGEPDPWALSLVVRVERADPPTRTDALVAGARAVVALLTDPRVSDPDGELRDAVETWRSARIRKIARRARGSRWERTTALPHVEATASSAHGTAVVRAFAPHPLGAAPPELQSLQVGGLELDDPAPAGGGTERARDPRELTIRLAPGVTMSAGKAVAQVGHAAQLALERLDAGRVAAWLAAGTPVRVVTGAPLAPPGERVDVRDGGYTEVAPGTTTASAAFEG